MTTTPSVLRIDITDNVTTPGDQFAGAAVGAADGSYFVTWVDAGSTLGASTSNIVARHFDTFGNPLSGEVFLNAPLGSASDAGSDSFVAATRLPIGGQADGLAVAYVNHATSDDIYVRTTNASLSGGTTYTVENSSDATTNPSITSFADGGLVVSYTSPSLTFSGTDVVFKTISPSGIVSGPFRLNNAALLGNDLPQVATLANGNFVAVWQSTSSGDSDIFFDIRNEAGNAVRFTNVSFGAQSTSFASPIIIIPQPVGPQLVFGASDHPAAETSPQVAALADGGFVVTWTDQAAGDPRDQLSFSIRAAVYDARGNLVQGNIRVNTTSFIVSPFGLSNDVTALPDGGFIVSWNNEFGGNNRAQRFDPAGNRVGTEFAYSGNSFDTNATTTADGRTVFTTNLQNADFRGKDVVSYIWDTRDSNANQVTGTNFFGTSGGTADELMVRDIASQRQLIAYQIENNSVQQSIVLGSVGSSQHIDGAGDFNHDGLSDLLLNVDDLNNSQRLLLIDQMSPRGVQAQFNLGNTGFDFVVDGIGDFNHDGTDDILLHRDFGGSRTLEILSINNNAVQSAATLGGTGTDWVVDGIGDFNGDGTADILQHRDDLSTNQRGFRVLSINQNQVQSVTNIGNTGLDWQVDGIGDFNDDGTSDILLHRDAGGSRTLEVLSMQNSTVNFAQILGPIGVSLSVDGVGDFNHDGTSDLALHQDVGSSRQDFIFDIINNTVTETHSIGSTGLDLHIS